MQAIKLIKELERAAETEIDPYYLLLFRRAGMMINNLTVAAYQHSSQVSLCDALDISEREEVRRQKELYIGEEPMPEIHADPERDRL